jgi:hypothetical protein
MPSSTARHDASDTSAGAPVDAALTWRTIRLAAASRARLTPPDGTALEAARRIFKRLVKRRRGQPSPPSRSPA